MRRSIKKKHKKVFLLFTHNLFQFSFLLDNLNKFPLRILNFFVSFWIFFFCFSSIYHHKRFIYSIDVYFFSNCWIPNLNPDSHWKFHFQFLKRNLFWKNFNCNWPMKEKWAKKKKKKENFVQFNTWLNTTSEIKTYDSQLYEDIFLLNISLNIPDDESLEIFVRSVEIPNKISTH